MKGIVLAGGAGTRLYPSTIATSKQLLPVYDKPMVYYPISVLMLAGIRDILIITTPEDQPKFEKLLGDGSQLGIKFSYKEQPRPEGIAQAFLIAEDFIEKDSVALILGDNIFYGHHFSRILERARQEIEKNGGASLFAYLVKDPQRFGVVEFDENKKALSIEEKPKKPKSQYAITGLYLYDNNVVKYAKKLKPSKRGELEITDINNKYLKKKNIHIERLERGFAWLDTGTQETMLDASMFIKTIEDTQAKKIACLEEVAYRMEYIDKEQLKNLSSKYLQNPYYQYIRNIVNQG